MVWEVMLLRERHNRQTSTLMTGVVPGNVVVVVVAVCAESRGEGPGVGRGEGVGGKGVGRVVEWGGVDTTVDWVTAACTEDRLFPAAFFPPLRGTLISTSCRAMDLSQHHFLHCTATAGSYTATAGSYTATTGSYTATAIQLLQAAIQLLQAAIQLLLYSYCRQLYSYCRQLYSYCYTATAGSYTATTGSYTATAIQLLQAAIQLLQAAIQLLLYMCWEGSAQWTMQAITSYIYTSRLLWCPWRQSTIAG